MQRRNQGRKLTFFDILKFIDEHDHHGACGLGRFSGLNQERSQVGFQLAVVGQTGLRFVVKTDFDVGKFELQTFGKTCQRPQGPL